MPQASTISRPPLPSAELNLGGTSTAAKIFTLATATTPCILSLTSLEALAGANSKRLSVVKITAAGRVTGGGTTNFTAGLYFGTSTTVASNTSIGTGATVAVNSVSGLWIIEGTYVIDNVSNKIAGYFSNHVAGSTVTYTAVATATTVITSGTTPALSFTTPGTAQGFVVAGTFSGGFAGNIAYLDVFQMEMVG